MHLGQLAPEAPRADLRGVMVELGKNPYKARKRTSGTCLLGDKRQGRSDEKALIS